MTLDLLSEPTHENLQWSHDLLKALLHSVPGGIVLSDEAGCIVHVNPQAEKLFGYSQDELLG